MDITSFLKSAQVRKVSTRINRCVLRGLSGILNMKIPILFSLSNSFPEATSYSWISRSQRPSLSKRSPEKLNDMMPISCAAYRVRSLGS